MDTHKHDVVVCNQNECLYFSIRAPKNTVSALGKGLVRTLFPTSMRTQVSDHSEAYFCNHCPLIIVTYLVRLCVPSMI